MYLVQHNICFLKIIQIFQFILFFSFQLDVAGFCYLWPPETQRQATQHDCVPRLRWGLIKWKSVRYILLGWLEQQVRTKKLSYTGMTSPTNQLKKDPFHMYTVSTVSRGHPSLVSLACKDTSERLQKGGFADCWDLGKWGLKEYKWKESFLGWFVGLFVPLQETFFLPWLL
jgi:hypothetical protein